jgi:hypothetical protein
MVVYLIFIQHPQVTHRQHIFVQ